MVPPQEIIDLVDVPLEPNLSFSPDRSQVLQLYRPPPLPPISEIARPELKLAGKPLPLRGVFTVLEHTRCLSHKGKMTSGQSAALNNILFA